MKLYPKLEKEISKILDSPISEERKEILNPVIQYLSDKLVKGEPVGLNFICTHNSRRSQLSQIWAHIAADYFGLQVGSFSGGVEVTEFNPRALKVFSDLGLKVNSQRDINPIYSLRYSDERDPVIAFSKIYSDDINPEKDFAAIMTCDHADENCPFIPGADERIAVRYEDPKKFDGTELEELKYRERSTQIASELFFVFRKVQEKLAKTRE